jgi:superfamily II DNA/RNA helicase
VRPPFLVLCPLSIVDNWANEFKTFAPSIKVIKYIGGKQEREDIREEIVNYIKKQPKTQWKDPELPFEILVTNYEMLLNDVDFMHKFKFRFVIVDEAHRLKNPESTLYQTMKEKLHIEHILLLTGTPIQNNLSELWGLLHFIMPKLFNDQEQFLRDFKPLDQQAKKLKRHTREDIKAAATKLHALMRPFILRRTKEDVLDDLPKKTEMILYTGLSAMQKKYYKWLLTKNEAVLSQNKNVLMNVIMNLRKCCDHPYLFDGAEPMFDGEFQIGDHIVENSGKMVLLDKLLAKLKKEGHKVLLFSQMTRMLDILQDYLHYKGYAYERLDGSVRGEERFIAIKNFNEVEDTFVFLLSTRAGGLGINLVSADVVIFFDSDWNPQQDLQAQARAHRIGQTKEVRVIRLVSQQTVEEVILRRAYKKLELKHKVLDQGNFSQLGIFSQENAAEEEEDDAFKLLDVIKFGLKDIVNTEDSTITDEDIEEIWKKGRVIEETAHLKKIEEKPAENAEQLENEDEDNLYLYEGKNYKEEVTANNDAFAQILVTVQAKPKKNRELEQLQSFEVAEGGASQPTKKRKRESLTGEELEERKKKKKEEKWSKHNYTSLAIDFNELDYDAMETEDTTDEDHNTNNNNNNEDMIVDDELEGVPSSLAFNFSAPLDDEKYLHLETGDATKPKGAMEPAIIVNCMDSSGKWGYGGFFNAISGLCPKAEETYGLAHKMGDLKMGDVHLVPVETGSDEDAEKRTLYVANLICQSRVGGRISAINMEKLALGLKKIALAAHAMKASVHLPRIGAHLPTTNYYSVERLIRTCISNKKIPTFIYYFPRKSRQHRQHNTNNNNGHNKHNQIIEDDIMNDEEIEDEEQEEEEIPLTKKGKSGHSATTSPSRSVNAAKSQIFGGLQFHLYQVYAEVKELKQMITSHGGQISSTVTENVNFIVTNAMKLDSLLQLYREQVPSVHVVNRNFVTDSIENNDLAGAEEYLIQ